MLVFEERRKPEYGEKPLREKMRTNNKLNQAHNYDAESWNWTQATLMGGECSYCGIPALINVKEKRLHNNPSQNNVLFYTVVYNYIYVILFS